MDHHHQAVVHRWVSEQVFGDQMPSLASTSCRLGKRSWNLETSSVVVEFPTLYFTVALEFFNPHERHYCVYLCVHTCLFTIFCAGICLLYFICLNNYSEENVLCRFFWQSLDSSWTVSNISWGRTSRTVLHRLERNYSPWLNVRIYLLIASKIHITHRGCCLALFFWFTTFAYSLKKLKLFCQTKKFLRRKNMKWINLSRSFEARSNSHSLRQVFIL